MLSSNLLYILKHSNSDSLLLPLTHAHKKDQLNLTSNKTTPFMKNAHVPIQKYPYSLQKISYPIDTDIKVINVFDFDKNSTGPFTKVNMKDEKNKCYHHSQGYSKAIGEPGNKNNPEMTNSHGKSNKINLSYSCSCDSFIHQPAAFTLPPLSTNSCKIPNSTPDNYLNSYQEPNTTPELFPERCYTSHEFNWKPKYDNFSYRKTTLEKMKSLPNPIMTRNVMIQPSKVIHLRNVADTVTDSDLIYLALPFGKISNVLILKGKKQALIEMESVERATLMVKHLNTHEINMKGRKIGAQYSTHKHIRPSLANPDELNYPLHPANNSLQHVHQEHQHPFPPPNPGLLLYNAQQSILNNTMMNPGISLKNYDECAKGLILNPSNHMDSLWIPPNNNNNYFPFKSPNYCSKIEQLLESHNDRKNVEPLQGVTFEESEKFKGYTSAISSLRVTVLNSNSQDYFSLKSKHLNGLFQEFSQPVNIVIKPETFKNMFGKYGHITKIINYFERKMKGIKEEPDIDDDANLSNSHNNKFLFTTIHYGALTKDKLCSKCKYSFGKLVQNWALKAQKSLNLCPLFNGYARLQVELWNENLQNDPNERLWEKDVFDFCQSNGESRLEGFPIFCEKHDYKYNAINECKTEASAKSPRTVEHSGKYKSLTSEQKLKALNFTDYGISLSDIDVKNTQNALDHNNLIDSSLLKESENTLESICLMNERYGIYPELEFDDLALQMTQCYQQFSSYLGTPYLGQQEPLNFTSRDGFLSPPSNCYQALQHQVINPCEGFTNLKDCHSTPVLLTSNLAPELTNPDRLFNLFGAYGDVQRIKILFNKRDAALIQMKNGAMAQLALRNLDKVTVFGRILRITPSIFVQIEAPSKSTSPLPPIHANLVNEKATITGKWEEKSYLDTKSAICDIKMAIYESVAENYENEGKGDAPIEKKEESILESEAEKQLKELRDSLYLVLYKSWKKSPSQTLPSGKREALIDRPDPHVQNINRDGIHQINKSSKAAQVEEWIQNSLPPPNNSPNVEVETNYIKIVDSSGIGNKVTSKKDKKLTKDYIDSPYHRFRNAGSKNYKNIYPPSNQLHVSNIPEWATQNDINTLFLQSGFTIQNFRFLPSKEAKKMALVALGSREEGIEALILLHNSILGDKYTLKISFARPRYY